MSCFFDTNVFLVITDLAAPVVDWCLLGFEFLFGEFDPGSG